MQINHSQFEILVKRAISWVAAEEQTVLRQGIALDEAQLADAIAVGIEHPRRVRLMKTDLVRLPQDSMLADFARQLGSTDATTYGRSNRYGVIIREDYWGDRELRVHELVHTRQYERIGSIEGFLRQYLAELLPNIGYGNGPLEREARETASRICHKTKAQN
jgi:hypothetical protein